MTTEQETNLREALQAAYPASKPPDALHQRVAALAEETPAATPPQRSQRLRVGLRLAAVSATVLAVFAFLLPPKLTAVQAYQRMADSLRDVRSAHYVTWTIQPDGKRVKSSEVWYQAGQWRTESVSGVGTGQRTQTQVCRAGKRWTYDDRNNTVTLDQKAFPEGMETSGFSITAGLRDEAAHGQKTQVHLLGATSVQGRPAHVILLYSQWAYDKAEPYDRSRIVVDDATGLPIRGEFQRRKPGAAQWVTASIGESQYNQSLPAALFTARFPQSARFIDAIAEREQWRQRLSLGVASQLVGKTSNMITYPQPDDPYHPKFQGTNTPTRIVVRDFQVNVRGDVFLLFTADQAVGFEGNNPFSAELTDEFGTKYVSSVFQKRSKFVFAPTSLESGIANNRMSGYLFNNEEVEGCWWVPLQPQGQWKPRRFTLSLRLPYLGNAVFDLSVQRPETANLPEYMPYMARPLPAAYMEEDDAQTRAYSYWHDAHDLPSALAWYRKTIDLNSAVQRKFGLQPYNAYQWFDMYQVLMEMGHIEEAKAALLRAKSDDDRSITPTETRPWIQAAMKKLGMTP